MKRNFYPTILVTCLVITVSGAFAQSLIPVGNTNFPVNDNTSSAPVSAINSGWQINGIGKIITIVPHPSILTKLYACTASGGIYVTTNSGTTWAPLTGSFLPGVQFGCLSVDPTNNNIMYAGTGEPSYAETYGWGGYGVFKTTDGGVTWVPMNGGMGNLVVLDLFINPGNTQEVIAGTRNGIYKTTNGGGSWTATMSSGNSWIQQVQRQGVGNNLVAVGGSRFYRSTDFGATWTTSDLDPAFSSTFANGRLAIAPGNANIVYAGWVNNTFSNANNACIFFSIDGGISFTKKYAFADAVKLISYDGGGATGYGWANFILTVDKTDPNTLFTGGHLIFKSTNNGTSWTPTVTQWWCCIHTDIRQLLYDPNNNNRILASTDGGVFLSTDGAFNWTQLSNGLYCNQYMSMGQGNLDPNFVIGGLQDNGIIYNNTDGNYHTYTGGDLYDHMTCDYTTSYNVYTSNTGGKVFNPYNRTQKANLNLPSNMLASGTANSRQSFFISPLNPAIAYGWGTNVYRSSNVDAYNLAANTSTVAWTQISTFGVTIKDLKISPLSNDVVYALGTNATVYKSINATGATPTFTPITIGGGATSNIDGSLSVSTLNPNVLYATANNAVYRSADAGATWTNYTATGLPTINFKKIFSDPYSTIESAYLITSLGVYYRDLTMTSWTSISPVVPSNQQNTVASFAGLINGTSLYKGSSSSTSHVSFATWGSGIWKATFYQQLNGILPVAFSNVDIGSPAIAGSAFYDNTKLSFNVNGSGSGINNTNTDQFNFTKVQLSGNGDISAKIYSVAETDMTNGLSKTGLMLRTSDNANAPYIMVALTGHAGAVFQYRTAAGNVSVVAAASPVPVPAYPYWLRLNKAGTTITAFSSPDGVVWTQVGQTTVDIGSDFFGGIANTSNNVAAINKSSVSDVTLNSFTALAIHNLQLQAVVKDKNKVGLSWSFDTDEKDNTITIERSTDGMHFTSFFSKKYAATNGTIQTISDAVTDDLPFRGNNFYRLKTIQKDGVIKYSSIELVNIKEGILIKVEPNPVMPNGVLHVIVSGNVTTSKITLDIYDMAGRKILSQPVLNAGINNVQLNNLAAGTYTYRVMQKDEVSSGKFVVAGN